MKGIRFFQTIQMKLIIIYVLLILIAMQIIGVYFIRTLETSFKENFSSSLKNQADLLAEYVQPYLSANQDGKVGQGKYSFTDLNDVINNLFSISDADIQIIDANGRIVSTSRTQLKDSIIGKKNTQVLVSLALQGIKDNEQDFYDVDGTPKKVIAQPVGSGTKVIGAIYIVASMENLYNTMDRVNRIFLSGMIIALVLTAMLGVLLAHTITNPIKAMTKQAAALAEGDFNEKVEVLGTDEIGQLAKAFNHMTERLKDALSINEEEKEKLASILANMSDGVIAADSHGKVILMNRRSVQMLRVKELDVSNQDVYELLHISKNELDLHVYGEDHTMLLHSEGSGKEESLILRLSFTPIHNREKGITGTIIVLQDVTEQEEMEQSRREFVANVSHELRTPLTTIKSYLEALEDGAVEDPKLAHRFVGVTRNEAERMIRLVNDLLQLSRLDSKQAIISKEKVDIREMLEDVADRFSFQLKQRRVEISIKIQPPLQEIMIDRDQIDQVLDNLISNAIKFTAEGGKVRIFAGQRDTNWLLVSVEDNGIGIPPKDLERIFDRFYRVDKARSRNMGGTGLGLSIAREIVKVHGGQIWLESELNRGTKVSFTLPIPHEKDEAV